MPMSLLLGLLAAGRPGRILSPSPVGAERLGYYESLITNANLTISYPRRARPPTGSCFHWVTTILTNYAQLINIVKLHCMQRKKICSFINPKKNFGLPAASPYKRLAVQAARCTSGSPYKRLAIHSPWAGQPGRRLLVGAERAYYSLRRQIYHVIES